MFLSTDSARWRGYFAGSWAVGGVTEFLAFPALANVHVVEDRVGTHTQFESPTFGNEVADTSKNFNHHMFDKMIFVG